jgi:hypothetical protein
MTSYATFDTTVDNLFFTRNDGNSIDDTYIGFDVNDAVQQYPIEASVWIYYDAAYAQTGAVDIVTDNAGNRLQEFTQRISIERIPPNIAAALLVANTDRMYVRFSEYVNADLAIDLSQLIPLGPGPGNLADIFEIVDESDNPTGVTITGFTPLQTRETAVPGSFATLDGYFTLSTTLTGDEALRFRIRNGALAIEDEFTAEMLASERNRVTDIALGVIEPVAAWNDLQREAGDEIYGDEFVGLLSVGEFDGSSPMVAGRDLTVQASILEPANAGLPVEMHFDMDPDERYLTTDGAPETPNRYWLPVNSSIVDNPDTPDTEVLLANPDARLLLPSDVNVQLREFIVPGDDDEMDGTADLQFLFTIDGVPAARVTDPTDPRTVTPWVVDLQAFIGQRGGVTILNNVIYPENAEQTVLVVDLARAGLTTINVFTLDGQLVRTLNRGRLNAGEHRFAWDGTNQSGQIVASGLYFVRVVSSGVDEIRKVLIAK